MTPISLGDLRQNAYRTLGLTAGATQADVDAAARSLRLWDDPSQIPPTANDAAFLGPVKRARQDIESAVSRLADPETRVEERLWWFCARPPENDAPAAFPPGPETSTMVHDAALARACAVLTAPAAGGNIAEWSSLIETVRALEARVEFQQWLLQTEAQGDFEKRASEQEIAMALRQMRPRLTRALAAQVESVLNANDSGGADYWTVDHKRQVLGRTAEVIGLLRRSAVGDLPREGASAAQDPVGRLLDRLEDMLVQRCESAKASLRGAWESRKVRVLKPACDHAARQFHSNLRPLADELSRLSDDRDRPERTRQHAADYLSLVAEAYAAAYDHVSAEETLRLALPYAEQTPLEPGLKERLVTQRRLAKKQRAEAASADSGGGFFSHAGVKVLIALVVITLLKGLGSLNRTDTDMQEQSDRAAREMRSETQKIQEITNNPEFRDAMRTLRDYQSRQNSPAGVNPAPGPFGPPAEPAPPGGIPKLSLQPELTDPRKSPPVFRPPLYPVPGRIDISPDFRSPDGRSPDPGSGGARAGGRQ